MPTYNNPNMGMQMSNIGQQYPYGNNNMLLNNTPYDNYMGRVNNLISNQFLKCRPVASREEAKAAQIDLDGSLNVFTDLGNDRIYTKKINNDGTASFTTYAKIEDEVPTTYNSTEYVTKEEFHKVIQGLMAAMKNPKQENTSAQNNDNKEKALMSF